MLIVLYYSDIQKYQQKGSRGNEVIETENGILVQY